MTMTILCDFLIPHRNTKHFCLYRKIICIKETYVFHVIAFNPKFISRNKPRSINIYVNSAFQPLLQFRCKTKEKRASRTLSYHLHLKDFYLLFSQHKTEDIGIMPTLLLGSHRKYYGIILVFPGHTPLGNSIPVQMSHILAVNPWTQAPFLH